ncbi:hypothetical protein M0R45_032915 [Rubus argutus]|uniref:RNase H type-1 domain-containing protein n=1 Tax=Rubus argutus TaxID=59490 RepID=A0AAW1WKN5_RUBAR
MPDPRTVASTAFAAAIEFLKANQKNQNQRDKHDTIAIRARDQKWVPPQADFVKLNTDGSWLKSSSEGGLGVIARNASGHLVGGVANQVQANSVIQVELLAISEALSLASKKRRDKIEIESDTRDALDAITGKKNSDWEAYPILCQIRRKKAFFSQIRWSWASREVNQAADCLASFARRRLCAEAWVDRPPTSLVFILSKDGLPCPPSNGA